MTAAARWRDELVLFPEDLPPDLPDRLRRVLQPVTEANDQMYRALCPHPDNPHPKRFVGQRGDCVPCWRAWLKAYQRARDVSRAAS